MVETTKKKVTFSREVLEEWLVEMFHRDSPSREKWMSTSILFSFFEETTTNIDFTKPIKRQSFGYSLSLLVKSSNKKMNMFAKRFGKKNEMHYIILNEGLLDPSEDYPIHNNSICPQGHSSSSFQFSSSSSPPPPPRKKQRKPDASNALCRPTNSSPSVQIASTSQITQDSQGETPYSPYPRRPRPSTNAPVSHQSNTGHNLKQQQTTQHVQPPSTPSPTATPTNTPMPPSLSTRAKHYIISSFELDLTVTPRSDFRPNLTHIQIPIRPDKRVSKAMRWHMVATAASLGYLDLSIKARKILIKAITYRECYLAGYKQAPSYHTFKKWWEKYTNTMKNENGAAVESVFNSNAGKG